MPSLSSVWTGARRAAVLVAAMALAGCGLDHVDVSAKADAVVPAATPLDTLLATVDFPGMNQIDFSESLANQGVSRSDVDAVHEKSFALTVTAPADGSFDFLDSIAFYAEADGQPRVRIAHEDTVPRGARELLLQIDDVDLAPYVAAPKMTIASEVKGHLPAKETHVHAEVVLDVDVNVTGS